MKKFEQELEGLQQGLCQMGGLVEQMVALAASAVRDRTIDRSSEATELETRLDQMQMDIDQQAVRLLTVYGPVASSLRQILVMTHVTSQMERIGDQVINVCKSLSRMEGDPEKIGHDEICDMADNAREMVSDAIAAYINRDVAKATSTRAQDDIVDDLDTQIIHKVLGDDALTNVLKSPQDIRDSLTQVLIAHHFERIADQAVNIAKEVIFMVSGDDVRHAQSPAEDSDTSANS